VSSQGKTEIRFGETGIPSFYTLGHETAPFFIAITESTLNLHSILHLGEQKLNDFSVGEAKIGEKQSRQSNSKYNFMQYVFFKKGTCSVQWGLGQSPRSWEFSRIFVLKILYF